jgi:Holliday junction DNA helicase RuvA
VIGFLRGRVLHSTPDHVLLDVAGVGYSVHIPVSTYSVIERARSGEPVELFIRTHVREDALDLYGFATEAEKRVFEALIGVSGIGPRLAQVILSGMGWEDLLDALAGADVVRLTRIPGVGKKTSERMVVELRDAAGRLMQELRREPSRVAAGPAEGLVAALVNLGYRQPDAEKAAAAAVQEVGATAAFAELLRTSLKKLSRA